MTRIYTKEFTKAGNNPEKFLVFLARGRNFNCHLFQSPLVIYVNIIRHAIKISSISSVFRTFGRHQLQRRATKKCGIPNRSSPYGSWLKCALHTTFPSLSVLWCHCLCATTADGAKSAASSPQLETDYATWWSPVEIDLPRKPLRAYDSSLMGATLTYRFYDVALVPWKR